MSENQQLMDALLAQAVNLHQAGQVVEAEQLYRRILQTYPKHVDVNHNLGLIAMRAGHLEAGLAHFKIAYDAYPANAQFALSYANALFASGYFLDAKKVVKTARQNGQDGPDFKKAQRAIDEAIADSLQNPGPTHNEWQSLSVYQQEQKWPELESRASKLTAQYPRSGKVWTMLAMALQVQEKDFLDAKRKAAQYSPRDANLQFSLSVDLRLRGLDDEAEALMRNTIKTFPELAAPRHNLGVFLNAKGRALEAGELFNKALEIDPDLIQSNCALALLMFNAGQKEKAAELMQRALSVKTTSVDDLSARGQTLGNLGDYEQAAHQFNQALQLNPQHLDSLNNLGTALKALGFRQDAAKCFYRAVELAPHFALAQNNLGLILHEDGEFDKAAICFRKSLEQVPNYVSALSNLGSTLLALGRPTDAAECLRYAATLTPADPLIHGNLGLALQRMGQLDAALQSYQDALSYFPDFAFVYANMGSIYATGGLMEQAEQAMTKALQLDPQDPRILALALLSIPYQAGDARFAQMEAMYANRAAYRIEERRFLCQAYGTAMEQIGEADKAKLAMDEAESLTAKAY